VTTATLTRGAGLRRWAPWLWVAVVLVALGVVAASARSQGAPLDPNGTGPQGAKALVLLLERYGAQVTVQPGVPGRNVGAAVVLQDRFDSRRRAAVAAWARAGGHLVVADPGSPLQVGAPTQATGGLVSHDLTLGGTCDLPAVGTITQLAVGPSLLLRVPPGAAGTATCFDVVTADHEQASFVVAVPVGSGTVTGLGGAGVWINQRLDQQDNAALAVGLLAPVDGAHVDVLVASHPGSGNRSLLDLLSPRIKWALLLLVVAYGLLVWWQGRRFGRPIPEAGPVQLAGSEIVVAVGELMGRTGNRDAAARQLRAGARSKLGTWLGLGPRATAQLVADALAARRGIPVERTLALLRDAPVADEAALVQLAQALADLNREVTGGRADPPD
jgi:hypothetical protein